MPNLSKDPPTRAMNRLRNRLPRLGLRRRPDAGNVSITHAHRINRNTFRDNQTSACSLAVVLADDRRRYVIGCTPKTCQWSHEEAVGKL